jgi:hypothetical protein
MRITDEPNTFLLNWTAFLLWLVFCSEIFAWAPVRWTNAFIRFGARFFLVMSIVGVIFYISLAILAVMGKHV